ncbi:MAG: DUF2953 domain-containing protein [Bacteroidota bacterium]
MPFFLLVVLLLVFGYFVPVAFGFRFAYSKNGVELRLYMTALMGIVRKEHVFLGPRTMLGRVHTHRAQTSPVKHEQESLEQRIGPAGLWDRLVEVRDRLVQYGIGGMFLSYFIPRKHLPWMHVAERLERKGRFTRLQWTTRIGLEEAAATAWAAGFLWACKGMVLAMLDQRYGLPRAVARIRVEPTFAGMQLDTTLECIFKLRAGHIISASVRGFLLDKLQRSVPTA